MSRPNLIWMRENVLQHLSHADQTIIELRMNGKLETDDVEPWMVKLFERRRILQDTLAELERQIGRLSD